VISLAFLNLTLLLTIFFFWASLHVLHQVTYIVELYNHKEHKFVRQGSAVNPLARMIDYAIVLTCLFPIAALKISQGSFDVGSNDLTAVIPDFFENTWFFLVMSSVFFAALAAYIIKSIREYRAGLLNWPKTIFIVLTVAVASTIPALPNLDTAFQGMNTWHSFQYLAITFYIIKIRQQYGDLKKEAPLIAKYSEGKDSRRLYGFSAMLLGGSLLIFLVVYGMTALVRPGIDPNQHFDIAYYTAILSFLWIHYYHDHFLFTDFEALDKAYGD
jgi:magnesium-transporting ATPase (P-type)